MGKVKMAAVARIRSALGPSRILSVSRQLTCSTYNYSNAVDKATHTGQQFQDDDYRKARFIGKEKLVTSKWAIDMVHAEPVVVCSQRVVFSDSKGALGHPRVYINLDPPEIQECNYSGRKFIHKKHYDASKHGPSITYEEYLEEMNQQP